MVDHCHCQLLIVGCWLRSFVHCPAFVTVGHLSIVQHLSPLVIHPLLSAPFVIHCRSWWGSGVGCSSPLMRWWCKHLSPLVGDGKGPSLPLVLWWCGLASPLVVWWCGCLSSFVVWVTCRHLCMVVVEARGWQWSALVDVCGW
jgi:hypothetical protein